MVKVVLDDYFSVDKNKHLKNYMQYRMAEEGTTFGFVNEYKMNEFTEEERIEFWENYFILERTNGKNAFGAGISDSSWVVKGAKCYIK